MSQAINIIHHLKNNLRELIPIQGLRIQFVMPRTKWKGPHPDFKALVSYKGAYFQLVGEIISQQSTSILQTKISLLNSLTSQRQRCLPILVAKYLSAEKMKFIRDKGVYFLDLSGNIFLEYDGFHVERTGFPNRFPEKRRGRGPFSDKASLILRAVFSDMEKRWGIRELAQTVGLNPGFVSRMASELEQRRYFIRKDSKLKIRDPKSLLEDWVRNYSYKKNQKKGLFFTKQSPDKIISKIGASRVPKKIQYALGFHAGTSLMLPHVNCNQVHIYVQNMNDIYWFAKKLKLKEADGGGNVLFLQPFYKHSIFYNNQEIKKIQIVSDLQLYLDLYNYPFQGRELAEHIYKKRLKQFIEDK